MTSSNLGDVLTTLRQAVRAIKQDANVKRDENSPGPGWEPPASSRQMLLQISALHKAFLAISDALLEMGEASRQQAAVWDAGLDGLRREMLARLEPAVSLQADLQQLVTIEAGLQAQGAALAERVAQLEEQAASLQEQVDQQGAEAAQAIRNQVTRAANTQFEEHLAHFEAERLQPLVEAALERQVQQWAAGGLAALVQKEVQRQAAAAVEAVLQRELQAVHSAVDAAQQACSSAAGLASRASADVDALAADVQHLTAWCERVDTAHSNHEQRLQHLEADAAAAGPSGSGAAAAGCQAGEREELARVAAVLAEQEARLSQLEGAMQCSAQRAADAERAATCPSPGGSGRSGGSPARLAQAAAAPAGHRVPGEASEQHARAARAQLSAVEAQLQALQLRLEGVLHKAGGELPAVWQRLDEVAAQQDQQGKGLEAHLHAVLTDVMALARHCRALDGEVRALRSGVGQVQQALLDASGTFARALNIPSPVGPFSSFPPQ